MHDTVKRNLEHVNQIKLKLKETRNTDSIARCWTLKWSPVIFVNAHGCPEVQVRVWSRIS